MRIGLLGGAPNDPRGSMQSAPENVLLRYLREAGHDVVPMSIDAAPPFEAPVDVYHANHFGIGAYSLMLSGARPFVFTSHNPFLVSDYAVVQSRIDRALQPALLRAADAVVALSRTEELTLRRRFALEDAVRFEVIPNGLQLELYGDEDRAVSPVGLEVLTVGQLVPYKGQEHLLRALAPLAVRFPELSLALVSHRHDARPQLERLAAELGIATRVSFEGPYDTRELARRYRRCAVYVQPSLAECFPVTVLEAMASGRPVIASDVGGVADELGDAGIVVPPGDEDALTAALGRLLESERERQRLGEAARARCHALYDGRRVAELHVSLYEELLESVGSRRPPAARRVAARAAAAAMRARRPIMGRLSRRGRR